MKVIASLTMKQYKQPQQSTHVRASSFQQRGQVLTHRRPLTGSVAYTNLR